MPCIWDGEQQVPVAHAIQAQGVNSAERIPFDIRIGVDPTREANWIKLNIPSDFGIIIPEVVVTQTRLHIEVLSRIAQVQGDSFAITVRVFVGQAVAEGAWLPMPDRRA